MRDGSLLIIRNALVFGTHESKKCSIVANSDRKRQSRGLRTNGRFPVHKEKALVIQVGGEQERTDLGNMEEANQDMKTLPQALLNKKGVAFTL